MAASPFIRPSKAISMEVVVRSSKRIISATTLSILLLAANSWAWQPADGPLMTRWSWDVSPERVWPEYPRPQMAREKWTNLNGLWQYAIRPSDESAPPKEWDGEILVPFPVESALSGVKKPVQPDQRLWY